MKFHITRAQVQDLEGIVSITTKDTGPNEFIKNHLKEWIEQKEQFYPLMAKEEQTKDYAGFCNTIKFKDYLWVEGLRVDTTYRNNGLATQLIQKSYAPREMKGYSAIGFTTRTDNGPMNSIAKKLAFKMRGQQIVFLKRRIEHKSLKQTTKEQLSVFNKNNNFYARLQHRYHSELYTSFFKIPPNKSGEELFSAIPGVERPEYYALYEKEHAETSAQRGIFTLYGKKKMSAGKVFEVITELEELEVVRNYPSYSFALLGQDIEITDEMYQIAQKRGFEIHLLNFYEKKLVTP